jgi:putative oxidoreductase
MIDDLGLLASRLALGLGLASHGAQKAFGWYEGPGPEGAAGFMESLGFKPGAQFAQAASYTEIGSGLAIALGLGGPLGPAALLSTMLVAQLTVHAKNGFFAQKGGVELGVVYSAGALALAAGGYGNLSLDRLLGLHEKLNAPLFKTLALAGGLAAGYAVLNQRDGSPPEGTFATPTIPGERDGGGNSAGGSNGSATGNAASATNG